MKTNISTIPINLNPAHPRGAVRTRAERWSATCRIGALAASLVLAALRAHASAGTLVSWGDDTEGEVSGTPTNGTFSAVSAGWFYSLGLRTDGTLVSWGADWGGQVSGTPTNETFSAVSAGGIHSLGLRTNGTLVSWGFGADYYGGTPTNGTFSAVSAGYVHSVALRTDGTLVSWGADYYGQVSGTPTNGTFSAVSAGYFHSVALRTDGTLVSWGNDAYGQVSGTPTNQTFSAVSAGGYHSVALRTDGTLVAWGDDTEGQVSGTPTNETFPAVSAGAYHTVALRTNGTLVSWGWDGEGEVSGTPTNGTFSAVSAGGIHSVAIKTPECGTPLVTISGPAGGSVYPANFPVTFTGTFDNANGPHSAEWIIDGNVMSATVNESAHTVSNRFTFTTPGVYAVQLRVTNNCGNSATADTVADLPAMAVIYDPSAGFVTGGGWINSPAGAFHPGLADFAGVTGKASFGFVSKYQKGANKPTGETEFQFKAGNLKFNSTSYDWLVVAGARAQYKGVGTINGVTGYGFLLTAIDGQVNGGGNADKFRVKIWETATSVIVYDNQMNALDGADPTTVIGGGSIVIHK